MVQLPIQSKKQGTKKSRGGSVGVCVCVCGEGVAQNLKNGGMGVGNIGGGGGRHKIGS